MKKFFKVVLKIVTYVLAFILPIVALAFVGYRSTVGLASKPANWAVIPESDASSLPAKSFDPAKPTVAIVLGNDQTEITDFLIPYELFSASEAYNVYAVAPERKLTTLSGGLEVMPDYSYEELNKLLGKSADVVMIPAIPHTESAQNQPVLTWIKQQSENGSFIFSICVGAEAFAATGLLDGRTATTHWGDIDRIQNLYPAVNWVRGVRYVDGGNYMTSAGITSGIDAVLHYIAQHNGEAVAQAVSQKIHYPSYEYVNNPQVKQYSAGADLTTVGVINILFHWNHPTYGVLLYDGVSELELASIFDTYAATYTAKLQSVSQTRRLITTQYGLQIVPRWDFNNVPALARLIVPGSQARQLAVTDLNTWELKNTAQVVFLHADSPESFAFDAPLKDLAHQENIPTAILDAKRLEYRPGTIQTEGSGWPVWLTIRPLLLGLASLAITMFISARLQRRMK
ncbi:MAG: DJ-1/PfpI family protein [Chloroflexota bacterium]